MNETRFYCTFNFFKKLWLSLDNFVENVGKVEVMYADLCDCVGQNVTKNWIVIELFLKKKNC